MAGGSGGVTGPNSEPREDAHVPRAFKLIVGALFLALIVIALAFTPAPPIP